MPFEKYALEPGGPDRLEIRWEEQWKNVIILFDQKVVEKVYDGPKALRSGRVMTLPDGSSLTVRLVPDAHEQWQVQRNNLPLLRYRDRESLYIQRAIMAALVVGALSLGLGLALQFLDLDPLLFSAFGIMAPGSIMTGLLLLGLGVIARQRRSVPALVTAAALFLVDGFVGYYAVAQAGGNAGIIGPVARAWFLYYMVQGIQALRKRQG